MMSFKNRSIPTTTTHPLDHLWCFEILGDLFRHGVEHLGFWEHGRGTLLTFEYTLGT